MSTNISFSLRAHGACKYETWVETMSKILDILNNDESFKSHFVTSLELVAPIENIYPAMANFSYTTNESKEEAKRMCHQIAASLLTVATMMDLEII